MVLNFILSSSWELSHGQNFLTTKSKAYSWKMLVRALFTDSPCKLLSLGSFVCLYPSGHFFKQQRDVLDELWYCGVDSWFKDSELQHNLSILHSNLRLLLLSVEQFGFLKRSFRLLRQGVRERLVCIVSDHFSTLYGTLFKISAIVVLLSSPTWVLNWVPLSRALVQSCFMRLSGLQGPNMFFSAVVCLGHFSWFNAGFTYSTAFTSRCTRQNLSSF